MDIYGIDGQPIITNIKLNAECVHEQEMMKSNFVKVSFRHNKRKVLPVGTNILVDGIRYTLLDPYSPTQKAEDSFVYEPEFQHPIMWLGKLPFIHKQGDTTTWATTQKKFDWTYTGVPQTLANEVARYINWLGSVYPAFGLAVGTGWTARCTSDLPANAEFSFSSVDILSGAAEMANVCECEYHFDFEQKIFYFGTVSYLRTGDSEPILKVGHNVGVANVSQSNEGYFNCFVVKGGTRNISQQTPNGDNVQVTERLSLDESKYPDSVIDIRKSDSEPKLFKEILFDDIYPKMELYLYNPRERRCWLIDSDTGERVETTSADGWYDSETGKYYKYYSKWYIRLAYQKDGIWYDYTIDPDHDLIKDKPLSLAFQPNYEGKRYTSPLIGREFELVYFDKVTTEKEQDDIEAGGFTAQPGDYRIVFLEGDIILPSTSKQGMCPKGDATPNKDNNIITLFNIVVDEVYKDVARNELEAAGQKAIARLQKDLNTYTVKSNPVYFEKFPRSLYLGQSVVYNDGQDLNGGTSYTLRTHIRRIVTRLDHPECIEISVGNEQIKGTVSSLRDQVNELSNGLIGGLTEEQFDELVQLYGSRHFLSKEFNDVAQGIITFLKGARFGNYREGEKGASINGYGDAEFRRLVVRLGAIVRDLTIGKFEEGVTDSGARIDEFGNAEFETLVTRALATLQELLVKGDSVFGGNLSSPNFISGFPSGTGWALQKKEYVNPAGEIEYKYVLECDGANIRGTLRVYEYIISQLLGENDNRIITAMMEVHHYDPTTGKVWLTTNGGRTYNVFRKDDCIEVQQYQPGNTYSEGGDGYVTKSYELLITAFGSGGQTDENGDRLDWVEFSNFTTDIAGGTPASLISKGDTFCRLDNLTDAERKGIIEFISIGTNAPYIDIIYGLKTDPDGYLKGRLGNLQGIHHHLFGWLQDFGEYLINAYIVGDVRLRRTGESLDTAVEILKGLLATKIAETVFEITDDDNYIRNAGFTELNTDGTLRDWTVTADAINFYTVEGSPVISSVGTFADVKTCVKTEMIDGKQVLHIVNGSIRQSRSVMKAPGTHKEYDEGESTEQTDTYKTVRDTLYLGIRIRCVKGGTLTIGFPESTMTEQNAMKAKTQVLERSDEWKTLQWQGTWDGKSDFVMRFTGECYITLLSLTDEPLSTFKTEYSTQIRQTSRNIQLIATRTTSNETSIAQLEVRADQITSTVQQNYETLDGKIGQNTSKITQTASEIRSEVTAVYDDLDGRVKENASSITQTATAIRAEVKSVDDKVDNTIERVGQLEVTDKSITARVSSVETVTSTHSTQISNLDSDLEGTQSDLNTTKGNLVSVTERVGQLEVTDKSITARVSSVETTTSNLTGEVANVKEDISELEMDIKGLTTTVGTKASISALNALSDKVDDVDEEQEATATRLTQTKNELKGYVAQFNSDGSLKTDAEISLAIKDVSEAKISADRILFRTFDWKVYNDDNDLIFNLDSDGNLSIAGKFHGEFDDTVTFGKGTKKMYIEPTQTGARLVGKDGNTEMLSLGFSYYEGDYVPRIYLKTPAPQGYNQDSVFWALTCEDVVQVVLESAGKTGAYKTLELVASARNGYSSLHSYYWPKKSDTSIYNSLSNGTLYVEDGFVKVKGY